MAAVRSPIMKPVIDVATEDRHIDVMREELRKRKNKNKNKQQQQKWLRHTQNTSLLWPKFSPWSGK